MKTPREIAIQWFLRLQHMDMEHPERTKFEAWLMADVTNQKAYAEVETLWSRLDSPAEVKQLTTALDMQTLDQEKFLNPKRFKISASVLSIVIIFAIGFFSYQSWQAQPVMQMIATTELGKLKSQLLDDGSKIVLNANSDVEVIYYRNQRTVNLKRGEAIFEVVPDADRPFVVDSGSAKVTVLGTRFAVNRLKQLVRISVDHGRVQVNTNQKITGNNQHNEPNLILTDGQVAEVDMAASETNAWPKRIDRLASDAFSFENGFITFKDAGLDEIAETLSRYRTIPVEASIQGQTKAHVTASIKANNIEKFIGNLPDMAPVTVKSSADKTILQATSLP